jgi:hypothetical protein
LCWQIGANWHRAVWFNVGLRCGCGGCGLQVLKTSLSRELPWRKIAWVVRALLETGAPIVLDTFEDIDKDVIKDLRMRCCAADDEFKAFKASSAASQAGGSPLSSLGYTGPSTGTRHLESLWPVPPGVSAQEYVRMSTVLFANLRGRVPTLFKRPRAAKRARAAEETLADAQQKAACL